MKGRLMDLSFSRNGENVLTIATRQDCRDLWDRLGEKEVSFSLKRYSKPRSLNANNYAWALMEKLAEASGTDKDSVYEEMLRSYGTGESYIDGEGNEVKVIFSMREGIPPGLVARHYAEIGIGFIDGKKFIHYRAIKGTSEYTTHEMSIFLDGVVYECKQLGIETATPEELARYKETWTPSPERKNHDESVN